MRKNRLSAFLIVGLVLCIVSAAWAGVSFKHRLRPTTFTKSIIINAALATDDFLVWKTPDAITITGIYCDLQSGTRVTGRLYECDSTGDNATSITNASIVIDDGNNDHTSDANSITNGVVDAGDWIQWVTDSVDAPGYLTVTVYYTIN